MDDATLESLHAALAATPDNAELRFVLVSAHIERGEAVKAADLLGDVEPTAHGEDHRRLAARALLGAERPDDALGALDAGDCAEPESWMLRAGILEALGRRDEGFREYQRAVAANAALEDPALRDRLSTKVRTFQRPDSDDDSVRSKLRVISNDDTEDDELRRLLQPAVERVDFSDVGGLDHVKQQVRKKIILPFQRPKLFLKFKKRVGGGILLFGPPGCGKTLLARATAGECNAQFFNVAISDVLDMYIGESEQKLHALFEKARSSVPSVLFFDEIEALGGKRQYHREGTSSKLVSQFLAEMDGFSQNNSGVLVLGATNVPWAVDSAFRRPGRFDRMLFVPPPDQLARRAILDILMGEAPVADDLDLDWVSQRTSGYSGADLENLVDTAADAAIEESIDSGKELPINQAHLRTALKDTKPTTLEWLTTARNYARYANEGGQYDEVLAFLDKHGKR